MKPRLVVASLIARGAVERARNEYDALVHAGDDDMDPDQVLQTAIAHQADALLFTNTLPFPRP